MSEQMQRSQIHRSLGRIEGTLSCLEQQQKAQTGKLDRIDGRLLHLERRSKTLCALTGSIAGVTSALVGAKVRHMLGL